MAEYYENTNLPVNDIVNEMGVISARTKIKGNVKTNGHLTIEGSVVGDVTAKGNIVVFGNVEGKITCNNLMVEAKKLVAEIEVQGTVIVKEDRAVVGNISCRDITVLGTVEGSIDAKDKVGLTSTASIVGDIKAGQIAVDGGAKIQGALMVG